MPINSADKKVKIYACRNATNNSKSVIAAEPKTLANVTPNQATSISFADKIMKLKITASTKWPPNMFAKRRTANTAWRITRPKHLNEKNHRDQDHGD